MSQAAVLAPQTPPQLPPPQSSASSRVPGRVRRLLCNHAVALVVIVAVAAILRFIALDSPPVWGDEAATFGRTCGTYRELIGAMARWAFVPLHYSLIWLIAKFTPLRPVVLRAAPAIAGVLTIPALYCLARELAGRRAALLTALLGACSAYLLNYSRDAKMYAEFWLFCTLNVAALLWWLRVRHALAWWTWTATAVAMIGLQLQGLMLIGIELSIVLTASRGNWSSYPRMLWFIVAIPASIFGRRGRIARRARNSLSKFAWPPLALFLLGVAITLPGPVNYFMNANTYGRHAEAVGWDASGLDWISGYNEGRSGPELPLYTATAYLTSWEWPRADDFNSVDVRTRRLLSASCIVIAAILAAGVLPWRSRRRWARCPAEPDACPLRWRPLLWITLWIVLPAYGCYLVSLPHGFTPEHEHCRPQDWLTALVALGRAHTAYTVGAAALALLCLFLSAPTWPRQLGGLVRLVLIAAITLALCSALAAARVSVDRLAENQVGSFWTDHGSVWMPRYLGISLPAVLIVVALLLLRLPTRPLRFAAVSAFVIINLAQHGARVFAASEPPTDLIAADIVNGQNLRGATRTYTHVEPFNVGQGAPGSGVMDSVAMNYYLCIVSGRPGNPATIHWTRDRTYRYFPPVDFFAISAYIKLNIDRNPQLNRIVVWDELHPGQIDHGDRVLDALTGWRRISDELFPVRDHWTWRDLYTCRRRVYQRLPSQPPASLPAVPPATSPAPRRRAATSKPLALPPSTLPAHFTPLPFKLGL